MLSLPMLLFIILSASLVLRLIALSSLTCMPGYILSTWSCQVRPKPHYFTFPSGKMIAYKRQHWRWAFLVAHHYLSPGLVIVQATRQMDLGFPGCRVSSEIPKRLPHPGAEVSRILGMTLSALHPARLQVSPWAQTTPFLQTFMMMDPIQTKGREMKPCSWMQSLCSLGFGGFCRCTKSSQMFPFHQAGSQGEENMTFGKGVLLTDHAGTWIKCRSRLSKTREGLISTGG